MKRALVAITVACLSACATSRDTTATRVRLTTVPDSAHVSLECGGPKSEQTAPVEFDFPPGPNARCVAELSAEHYKPALVYIDRQYLFDHGEFRQTHDSSGPPPRIAPVYGPVNWLDALFVGIELGIDHLVNAAHRAAVSESPDVTLKILLQRESSS